MWLYQRKRTDFICIKSEKGIEDRNGANFGFFMDNRSGKLQGLYPLMDHDHAFLDEIIYFRITFECNSDTKGSD